MKTTKGKQNYAPPYSTIYFVSTRLTAAKLPSWFERKVTQCLLCWLNSYQVQTCEKGKPVVSFCFTHTTLHILKAAKGPSSLKVFQTKTWLIWFSPGQVLHQAGDTVDDGHRFLQNISANVVCESSRKADCISMLFRRQRLNKRRG